MKFKPSEARKMSPALRRPCSQPSSNDPLPLRQMLSAMITDMPSPKQLKRKIKSARMLLVKPPSASPLGDAPPNSCTSTPSTPVKSGASRSAGLRNSNGIAWRYTLEARSGECRAALARVLFRRRRDDAEYRFLHTLVITREYLHDFFVRDRFDAGHTFETDIVIGDQRDIDVAHLELASQIAFGILRHVDDFPAVAREPLRFGARREARPLNDDDRPVVVRRNADLLELVDRDRTQLRTIRICKRDVRCNRAVVKRILAARRAIDDLIAYDHLTGRNFGIERTARRRSDDARDAELFHRPQVCAVIDRLRRKAMIFSVPRQKRDFLAGDFAERNLVARSAVRSLHPDLARVLDQRIKPGSTKNADLGAVFSHVVSLTSKALRPRLRAPHATHGAPKPAIKLRRY